MSEQPLFLSSGRPWAGTEWLDYGQMVCRTSNNIGDDIQSIAAAQLLPRVDLLIDREELKSFHSDRPACLVMNAWFMHNPKNWPPSDNICPIFVGFHVEEGSRASIAKHAHYLKKYEPIGTRDRDTSRFLAGLGLSTEVTFCLSLTFPERDKAPTNGKVVIVDADHIAIPRALKRGAVSITHKVAPIEVEARIRYATQLIKYYHDNAALVITTRLHSALPCTAMGIPTIFFGDPSSMRLTVLDDIGGQIHNETLYNKYLLKGIIGRAIERVNWAPKPLDVSHHKARLLQAFSRRIEKILLST